MNQRILPIDKVRNACNSYLQKRTESMKQLQEPYIQKEMKGGWFRKPKTRSEAIESLYGDLWSKYNMLQLNHDWHTQKVNELVALCQTTYNKEAEVIMIDSETVYILRKYL
jgi:hypothetical protein